MRLRQARKLIRKLQQEDFKVRSSTWRRAVSRYLQSEARNHGWFLAFKRWVFPEQYSSTEDLR